jgi:hypothetical protein
LLWLSATTLSAVSDGTNGDAIGAATMTAASTSDQPKNIADATDHIAAMAMRSGREWLQRNSSDQSS